MIFLFFFCDVHYVLDRKEAQNRQLFSQEIKILIVL